MIAYLRDFGMRFHYMAESFETSVPPRSSRTPPFPFLPSGADPNDSTPVRFLLAGAAACVG